VREKHSRRRCAEDEILRGNEEEVSVNAMNNPYSVFGVREGLDGARGTHCQATGNHATMQAMHSGRAQSAHVILHAARTGTADKAMPFSPQLAARVEAAVEAAKNGGAGARIFSPGPSTPRAAHSECATCISVYIKLRRGRDDVCLQV
jgi:hypothetical protein